MPEDGGRKSDREERSAFPSVPQAPDIPEVPKLNVTLPPRDSGRQAGAPAPGAYKKLAIAATAASSFVMPIIVLGAGGWWLDQRLHFGSGVFAFLGAVVGFAVGIISLMRIIKQLNR